MKNITISMPDDLARKVRVMAAEADTSMSQFLCRLVEERAVAEADYRAAMERYLGRGSRTLRDPSRPLPDREERNDRYDRYALR